MVGMSKKPEIDEATARELLASERKRIESSLADNDRLRRGDHEEAAEEADLADKGERIEEDGIDEALERRLRSELEAVGQAEQRLADGTYGLSVESGEPIPEKRLRAVPWAERTAEEQQRRGG
jgi:DnaK suppressor protein